MPRLDATAEEIRTPGGTPLNRVTLKGLISTPTLETFRNLTRPYAESGTDMGIDFGGVTYVNSSGLGELVSLQDALRENNASLTVFGVSPEVKQLMTMLGLQESIHVFDTEDEAVAALDSGLGEPAAVSPETPDAPDAAPRAAPIAAPAAEDGRSPHIVFGLANENHLTRFLESVFATGNATAEVASTQQDFVRILANSTVDMVVLDRELDGAQDITAILKTDPDNGLVSVIAVKPEGANGDDAPFRVLEDEYVVEPFEVRELVTLMQSEMERCREERVLFRQEAHFSFDSTPESKEKADAMVEEMLRRTGMEEDKREAFFYGVREALDNSRRHGNGSDPEKRLDLLYVLDREKITVTVEDEGPGFDFQAVMEEAGNVSPLEKARKRGKAGKHGGLGINLMLRCCDKVEYIPPGNIIKLTRFLG